MGRRAGTWRARRRWTPWLLALPLAVVAGAAPSTGAQEAGDLYTATITVTGYDTRSRPYGFAQTLRAVLVNVSGEPRLRDDPRVAALAAHADALVASFSYVDLDAANKIHDDQGTYDRPHDLTVHFVPALIDNALANLGEKPWRGTRPVVVPVLAVRGFTGTYLLSADNPAGAAQRQAFADVAGDFYMKVRFPAEADFAAWGIRLGRFPAPPSSTAPNEALVAGTLEFQESLPGWIGTWRMRWRGVEYAWGVKGGNYDGAFRDIVRGVLRVASGHGAPD